MILRYCVNNFKNIAHATEDGEPLSFSRLNLFIGPNGVGKSSLLQSIDFLRAFFYDSIELYLRERNWDYRDITNLRRTQKKIDWDCQFLVPADDEGNLGGLYNLKISVVKRRYINVGEERLSYIPLNEPEISQVWMGENYDEFVTRPSTKLIDRRGRDTILASDEQNRSEEVRFYQLPSSVATYITRDIRDRLKYPEIVHFMEYILSMKYASIFDVEHLREPKAGYTNEIGPKGQNLIPTLAHLKHSYPKRFDKIRKEIRKLSDHVTDFDIRNSQSKTALKKLEVQEGDKGFSGKQVSDGFLRTLAIVSMRYAPNPPKILFFEEPENGVHPRLLYRMVDTFRGISNLKPPNNVQVFLTSHSPYLLDEFRENPGNVYALSREKPQSPAKFERLDRRFPNGLPEYPLGETWFQDLLGGA